MDVLFIDQIDADGNPIFGPSLPDDILPPIDNGTVAARYARPVADISTGSWQPSVPGASLASMIDDQNGADGDYITTVSAGDYEGRLQAVQDPGTDSGQVVRYAAHSPTGSSLTVQLKQGEVVIAGWHHDTLPLVPTVYEQILTPKQCDAIIDYANLRIKLVAA